MILALAFALTWQSAGLIGVNANALLFDDGKLYAATDSGITWSAVNRGLPSPIDVSSILVDNDSNIYLGSRDNGIFKSTDGGMSWSAKPTGISGFVITLAIDPRDSAIV